MFKRDQGIIGEYARENPDHLARVITFVYLTIQQPIQGVAEQMEDVDRRGVRSKFLWGFKTHAYEWLQGNKEQVYERTMDLHYGFSNPVDAEVETLRYFASLPGLGLVKGGFANQLVFGETGCMDTHNAILFEIDKNKFHASNYKRAAQKTRNRLSLEYAGICEDQGGAEFLWDNWCGYVGNRIGHHADTVSAMHTRALGL